MFFFCSVGDSKKGHDLHAEDPFGSSVIFGDRLNSVCSCFGDATLRHAYEDLGRRNVLFFDVLSFRFMLLVSDSESRSQNRQARIAYAALHKTYILDSGMSLQTTQFRYYCYSKL